MVGKVAFTPFGFACVDIARPPRRVAKRDLLARGFGSLGFGFLACCSAFCSRGSVPWSHNDLSRVASACALVIVHVRMSPIVVRMVCRSGAIQICGICCHRLKHASQARRFGVPEQRLPLACFASETLQFCLP